MRTADITILGGLPVTVEYAVYPAERDVGIMSSYVGDWDITHINGRFCKTRPSWLIARIDKTKGEEDRIVRQLDADYE